jgi:hypothetical protein
MLKLYGQDSIPLAEGRVSYITLQNIYAKFDTPGVIQPGDTIFIRKNQTLVPLFVSESVSSVSSAGKPIGKLTANVSDVVFAKIKRPVSPVKKSGTDLDSLKTVAQDSVPAVRSKTAARQTSETERHERIRGRLSVSSYSSFSNTSDVNQRMRYTFSLSAENISGGRVSTDSYIMFTHRIDHWAEVQDNIFNALKIYSLAIGIDVTDKTKLTLGRKINPRVSSIGAIDGLQADFKAGNFAFGLIGGTNPDHLDYGFNSKLLAFGAYFAHEINNKQGIMSSSLAFFEQRNRGNTDRRFAYFQHDNSLAKNINLFASAEVDLYALKDSVPTNTISLTGLYLSLRYKLSKQLSAYLSYDARKNVIYYETFKNFLDQMLLDATRQGYQVRINYRPSKSISSSLSGGYRFQKKDIHPMLNINEYLTFSNGQSNSTSVTFTFNWLKSSYVDGMIYGVHLNTDLVASKLNTGLGYRLVDNNYLNSTSLPASLQHMAEFELLWQISRKMSFSANYNGTFEKSNQYNSVYVNLVHRF